MLKMEGKAKRKIIFQIISMTLLQIGVIVLFSLAFKYPSENFMWICIIALLVLMAPTWLGDFSFSGLIGIWIVSVLGGMFISWLFRSDYRLIGLIIVSIINITIGLLDVIDTIKKNK